MTEPIGPAQALHDAHARLAEADGRWQVIRAVVEPLFAARQENHFAERIRAAVTMPREGLK